MKKSQLIILGLLFILQFGGLYAANRQFINDMRNDREVLVERLRTDGVPTSQINAIDSVLTNTMLNVSSFMNLVALILILANSTVAKFLLGYILSKKNEEDAST